MCGCSGVTGVSPDREKAEGTFWPPKQSHGIKPWLTVLTYQSLFINVTANNLHLSLTLDSQGNSSVSPPVETQPNKSDWSATSEEKHLWCFHLLNDERWCKGVATTPLHHLSAISHWLRRVYFPQTDTIPYSTLAAGAEGVCVHFQLWLKPALTRDSESFCCPPAFFLFPTLLPYVHKVK